MLTGRQFNDLCDLLELAGFYVRKWDPKGAVYIVRDIQPKTTRAAELEPVDCTRSSRCPRHVAQLWFTILDAT